MSFRVQMLTGKYLRVSLFLLFACFVNAPKVEAWEGVVTKVLDGDSIRVQRGDKTHEIRLYGIDTPEYGQAFSQKAKKKTRKLVFAQKVEVDARDTDRYGRIVAVVTTDGNSLNLELVRRGLAWVYPRYCKDVVLCAEMEQAERTARREHRGLWTEKNPMPPWQWKRQGNGIRSHR